MVPAAGVLRARWLDRQSENEKASRFLQLWVKGFLIPGSTGHAWELSDREIEELTEFALDEVRARRSPAHWHSEITVPEMVANIKDTVGRLKKRTRLDSDRESLFRSSVCGFTVGAP